MVPPWARMARAAMARAEAGSSGGGIPALVHPVEGGEDPLEMVLRNAGAFVADDDADFTVAAGGRQRHRLPLVAVADGIAERVLHRRAQRPLDPVHDEIVGDVGDDLEAGRGRLETGHPPPPTAAASTDRPARWVPDRPPDGPAAAAARSDRPGARSPAPCDRTAARFRHRRAAGRVPPPPPGAPAATAVHGKRRAGAGAGSRPRLDPARPWCRNRGPDRRSRPGAGPPVRRPGRPGCRRRCPGWRIAARPPAPARCRARAHTSSPAIPVMTARRRARAPGSMSSCSSGGRRTAEATTSARPSAAVTGRAARYIAPVRCSTTASWSMARSARLASSGGTERPVSSAPEASKMPQHHGLPRACVPVGRPSVTTASPPAPQCAGIEVDHRLGGMPLDPAGEAFQPAVERLATVLLPLGQSWPRAGEEGRGHHHHGERQHQRQPEPQEDPDEEGAHLSSVRRGRTGSRRRGSS
jgi:hypothetical protein